MKRALFLLALILAAPAVMAQEVEFNQQTVATPAATITGQVPVANGGCGATTAQGCAANLSVPHVLCQSAVAVSGPADTAENVLYTCSIPAGAIGANGRLRVYFHTSYTNSANTKAFRVRLGGVGGTIFMSQTGLTTQLSLTLLAAHIANRNATNSQISTNVWTTGTSGPFSGSVTGAVDSTQAQGLVITCEKATGAEACTLESVLVELMHGT